MFGLSGAHLVILLLVSTIMLVPSAISVLLVRYICTFWGRRLREDPRFVMPLLPCLIIGPFVPQFSIPIALVTWILSFVYAPRS